jgi:hypothetical protein
MRAVSAERQPRTGLMAAMAVPSLPAGVTRESLPDAVAATFDAIVATTALDADERQQQVLKTSDDWAALITALANSGLLPQTELLAASRDLSLPASLPTLVRRLNVAHAPPRADKVDTLLEDAVARVRHLHGLLAEWELGSLSAEQTARLVAMLEALRGRLGTSVARLRDWHDGIHATLGPERCQSLFWDLLDPSAAERDRPHAFQREQLGAIERRCAQQRIASATLPPSASAAAAASAALRAASAARNGGGVSAFGGGFGPGIDVVVGTSAEERASRLRVVRCPHAHVSWSDAARLHNALDATRQLALSRHAAAFLGHIPHVPASAPHGYPAHARWHLELVSAGGSLAEGLLEGGALPETSLLFRHWRRELIEALYHLSAHTTFLLMGAVDLSHVYAMDYGTRLVLDQLPWGAEFPELPAEAVPHTAGAPIDHQALRDVLLLYDGVAMLKTLLGATGKPLQGVDTLPGLAPGLEPAEPLESRSRSRPVHRSAPATPSAHLAAILDACSHTTKPPTLRQLLSHPYFAPIDGFDREDIRAAYLRWRQQHAP